MPDHQVQTTAIAPSPALRPYVRQFMVIENFTNRSNILLPEAAILAGFRFRGECSQDGSNALCAVVTGLRDKPRRLSHSSASGTIVAMFTANGAAALLREPPEELFNATMPIEFQVGRSQLDVIEEQLAEAPNHIQRAQVLDRFLLGQRRERKADRIVAAAVSCIRESRGRMPENARRGQKGSAAVVGEWPVTALLFLEARDLDEATQIAETHPALRLRASVEVRAWNPPVRPTPAPAVK